MMQSFQQMAVSCSFDESLIAFHGAKLSEKQIECLAVIHKSTIPWTMGNAARILMGKLNSNLLSGKDAKDIAQTIQELAGRKTPEAQNPTGVPTGTFRIYEAKID